ncbi:hypothetical protein [Xanthomonas vesicatoria]|uniref:Anti-sigma factor n=2 Tax=Xanthomonas vesicatoria TaxID=56460 RepID=A0ABS8L7Q0_9XANT|nr:hypothetical protein [Xanthomonas vesicatoria]APO97002.1 hypothetical protein BI313_22605 [Xanthomonas vesicatoria]APP77156.1 hypothetical protein BJD12_20180 [Xanthomonas vesicatoria ATCC 35937]EGD07357.1 hypothetical protein XVE_4461 [Xanthomonas vesicatoria ATCC 35937]MCC8597469.1 hypothetical protein [Xanthomonas vesicatoria]MCC8606433.1 hypothetical protein [Xanthomonas vesicatoria]
MTPDYPDRIDAKPTAEDAALHARLQALPQQRQPPAQVWERIAPALLPHASVVALRPRRRGWAVPVLGVALAAAVALVAVVPGLRQHTSPQRPSQPALVMQARAMAGQYQQAIAQVPVQQVPADLRPALDELDQSAQAIHAAIAQSPQSAFLLSQLQRTYAKRLQLTRLAAQGQTPFLS